jgi:hypothetical protein
MHSDYCAFQFKAIASRHHTPGGITVDPNQAIGKSSEAIANINRNLKKERLFTIIEHR